MSLNNNCASAQFLGLWICATTEDFLFTVRIEESGQLRHFRINDTTALQVIKASFTTLRQLGLNPSVVVKSDLDFAAADEALTDRVERLDQRPQTLIAEVAEAV